MSINLSSQTVENIDIPSGDGKGTMIGNILYAAYPVYHITANTDGSKLYFYNKLNSYNTGLYVYGNGPVVNINDQQSSPEKGIETAIGDCIYNPYTDHFLVSENNETAKIKVFNTDLNNSWNATVYLPANTQFPKKMFIAPNEKLYVMANMHKGLNPKICIYDANDYTFIQAFDVTDLPNNDDEFEYYSAHFCYNHYNHKVYATIHPTEINLNPYNTVPNSMFEYPSPNQGSNDTGLMIRIDENQIDTYELVYPGKIICPDNGNPEITSQYDGKMFIIGKKFYVYNFFTDAFDPANGFIQPFNDITYSAFHDKLFCIRDVEDECSSDRKCEIYSIDCENSNIAFNQLGYNIDGQAASIFSNPYDGKVYIYNKFDDEKLGGTEARLFYFDPGATSSLDSINLGITSYYPELDHCGDYFYNFYNITTPYIDPYDNAIYVPNGGHSCVSKVPFVPNEPLLLRSGWAWLSFPRLNREEVDPPPEEVLSQDNFSYGYDSLYMEHLEVDELGEQMTWVTWDEYLSWRKYGLDFVFSKKGYKLWLYPEQARTLYLEGTILDPETALTLYPNYENWAGYFITYPQDAFDALADILDQLSLIKHQDWACKKFITQGEYGPDTIWTCYGSRMLNYGDMVILKSYSQLDFTWIDISVNEPNDSPPEPEYFTYEEKADYTPVYIELDTSANPQEIGAFAGDTCIGACAVVPGDSLVMIRTYTEGTSGGEITFENYYGSTKSVPLRIEQYYVLNPQTLLKEKRTIRTYEKQDAFLVSFKKDQPLKHWTQSVHLTCRPNPFAGHCRLDYFIPCDSQVKLQVFDIYGKSIALLQEGIFPKGDHRLVWKPGSLAGGVYIVKLKAGKYQAQTKIIIIK